MRCKIRRGPTIIAALAVALTGCVQHQAASFVPSAEAISEVNRNEERLIYSFPRWRRGGLPIAGLVAGDRGEMCGATVFGGTGDCHDVYPGCGIVFKLTPAGGGFKESTAYNFKNHGDGGEPQSLVRDSRGALYGITSFGYQISPVLFRLVPCGNRFCETTLYRFSGLQNPEGSLTLTPDGSLYGTNASFASSYGMIFRFTPSAAGFNERILFQFDGSNGIDPRSPLLVDSSGVIFGTTSQGGTGSAPECLGGGCGTIFMLTPSASGYTETVLYNFNGINDGAIRRERFTARRRRMVLGIPGTVACLSWRGEAKASSRAPFTRLPDRRKTVSFPAEGFCSGRPGQRCTAQRSGVGKVPVRFSNFFKRMKNDA